MEDEEESIIDAINVTADAFSHVSSSQRENLDTVFTSEKIDKSDDPFKAMNSFKINSARYELSAATTSDAQGNLTSNP